MSDPTDTEIREAIRHVLKLFPRISHSMLQVGLGPQMPARLWRPVLNDMVEEYEIGFDHVSLETPKGRVRNYTIIFNARPE